MQYREYQSDDLPPSQPASELASHGSRLAAYIIDLLIFVISGLITVLAIITESLGPMLAGIVVFIVILIIQMVLQGTRGQTIGKILMKIRIVDWRTGEHPGWMRLVLLRGIFHWGLSGSLIYWLVDSLFIFREDRRTIHDLYSETRVDKL